MLIHILIVFFLFLVLYQIYLALFYRGERECLENQVNCNDPNSRILGEIQVIQNNISNVNKQITDMSLNIIQLNDQVQSLIQQQADAAQQLTGGDPLTVTGTQPDSET